MLFFADYLALSALALFLLSGVLIVVTAEDSPTVCLDPVELSPAPFPQHLEACSMPRPAPFPYTLDPEQIPTAKVLDITPEAGGAVHVNYACPDACWKEHLSAWIREHRKGNKTAPRPEPYGHCMFEKPVCYGCIPYGCTDPATIRAAHEQHVRGLLHGWDRDLTREQLDTIVNATVDARLRGEDLGAAPFVACIYAGIDR